MKRTNKYQLAYFEKGDITSPTVELQRWETVDAQLSSLFNVIGNGVISGWEIEYNSGLSVIITAGSGHIAFVAVESTASSTITSITGSKRNYIYAHLATDSYFTKTVLFSVYLSPITSNDLLYLGYVDAGVSSVTDVNIDNRKTLGFKDLVTQLIAQHRHIGGTNNPSPIDLSSEVTGILKQENLPDMDASVISTGILDVNRIPSLDHNTKLTNVGLLKHTQLDSFVDNLNNSDKKIFGEVAAINLLQLTLSLKHIYPTIDDYFINQIAYIPGISPDSFVDWVNTTAIVDIKTASEGGQHTITGAQSSGLILYEHVWDTADDYEGNESQNIIFDANTITLNTKVNEFVLDQFTDVSKWKVTVNDMSAVDVSMTTDGSSGSVNIGDKTVEVAMTIQKSFEAQDWSNYKYLTFYLNTATIEHGDLFFYINDSKYGSQNSYKLLLPRNVVTINNDTLENGWQEFTIDISNLKRSSIDTMTFFISTQSGWDTSKNFQFSLKDMVLKSGNIYENNGYIRTIYGSDFYCRFSKVKWDTIVPSDSYSSGIIFRVRYRFANVIEDIATAQWSDYTSVSGTDIALPSDILYKYIQIEAYFGASVTLDRAPTLIKLYVDFYISELENKFVFDSQSDWNNGSTFNIDSTSEPGSIKIYQSNDIGSYFYGAENQVGILDSGLNTEYSTMCTSLPISTPQAISGSSSSLGVVTAVQRGDKGSIWVADIDNDRVVEIDKYGNLIRGFYGSFLSSPYDPYGTEENGVGSNTNVVGPAPVQTQIQSLQVLHTIYNSRIGVLYIVFNGDLENIYASDTTLDMNKIYIKVGSHRVYFNHSTAELLGVSKEQYESWKSAVGNSDFPLLSQVTFSSHVLKINVLGADRTILDYFVNQKLPTVSIMHPNEQKQITVSDIQVKFTFTNFILGTKSGENALRVKLDNGVWNTIYSDSYTFSGLSDGKHAIDAQLVDSNGAYLTNIGAEASVSFIVTNNAYNLPILSLVTPSQNQIVSSTVTFEFSTKNFPIIPSGQHIRYSVDGGSYSDQYSYEPFTVTGLSGGSHTINMYFADKDNNKLVYPYGELTSKFLVGYNPNATATLYVDTNAIKDINKNVSISSVRKYIEVGDIIFSNLYAPIDLQVIPADIGGLAGGLPTLLIAKLRSPTFTTSLGNSLMAVEYTNRAAKKLLNDTTDRISTNTIFTNTKSINLIFPSLYLDGHSVIQMDMDGNVVFSNNAAIFSDTKANAKDTLGSVEKLGGSELLIGDSINKRGIITYTDLSTQIPVIEWEYTSDRNVVDFHIATQTQRVVDINNDSLNEANLYVRQGYSVTWVNKSASPVTIYSGTTSRELFYQDPNLNRFGDIFKSGVLNTGDSYTFTFNDTGSFDYFTYPDILTGEVVVTEQRISSRDNYYLLESDGKETPFNSRLIKVDSYGNVIWSFGESYLVKPRDFRLLENGNILIST